MDLLLVGVNKMLDLMMLDEAFHATVVILFYT